jgi:hypothetical protein
VRHRKHALHGALEALPGFGAFHVFRFAFHASIIV